MKSRFTNCALPMFMILGSIFGHAGDMIERMERGTVRISCNQGKKTGSGFIIGQGDYVITNWHVVDSTDQGDIPFIALGPDQMIPYQVAWKSQEKDLAILKGAVLPGKEPVSFAASETVSNQDDVYALGFPSDADREGTGNLFIVKHSKGIISARDITVHESVHAYQHTAGINPGNSGGPLFNACGQVIGINTEKSLAEVIVGVDAQGQAIKDRVTKGDDIGWSVKIEEILPTLRQRNIPFELNNTPCQSGVDHQIGQLWWAMILMGGLTLILLAMMLHQKTRTQIVAAVTRMGNPSQDSEKPRTRGATSWWLIATSGQYSGSELELKGILQLGRDPRIAQFIFEDPDISKLHITLTLNDECMTLEDQYSTNGTQLNGHDVPPGEEIAVNSGDLIRLAETQEIFKVEKR